METDTPERLSAAVSLPIVAESGAENNSPAVPLVYKNGTAAFRGPELQKEFNWKIRGCRPDFTSRESKKLKPQKGFGVIYPK